MISTLLRQERLVLVSLAGIAVVVAGLAMTFFWIQGGFGGGHGDFDRLIYVLGLPWAAIPWPDMMLRHDFVWLIGIPLVLNLFAVAAVTAMVGIFRRRHSHPA